MAVIESYPAQLPTTLGETEPIGLSQGQLITERVQLEKYVEGPALPACQDLYDRNIQTVSASANRKDREQVYVDIDAGSLSPENRIIADELGGFVFSDQTGQQRIKLSAPVHPEQTAEEVAETLRELAGHFEEQPLTWAPTYTFDDLKATYGYSPGEAVEPADFVAEGYCWDPESSTFYLSEELFHKANRIPTVEGAPTRAHN